MRTEAEMLENTSGVSAPTPNPAPAAADNPPPGQLYRVRQPKPGLDLIRLSELAGALFADVPCGQTPDSKHVPTGEWYCETSVCPVREVHIRQKHFGRVPKGMRPLLCPACAKPLKFHHFIRTITLLPADREGQPCSTK